MNKNLNSGIVLAIVLVVLAALSRLALYPHNFSPVIAMALLSGAVIRQRNLAFMLPVAAMLLSDILFEVFNIAPGFWGWGQLVNYLVLVLVTIIGFSLHKMQPLRIAGCAILSSLLFFALSNTAVWMFEPQTYSRGFSGWMNSLIAGLPFLKNSMIADLVYSGVLFGGYALLRANTTVFQKAS